MQFVSTHVRPNPHPYITNTSYNECNLVGCTYGHIEKSNFMVVHILYGQDRQKDHHHHHMCNNNEKKKLNSFQNVYKVN